MVTNGGARELEDRATVQRDEARRGRDDERCGECPYARRCPRAPPRRCVLGLEPGAQAREVLGRRGKLGRRAEATLDAGFERSAGVDIVPAGRAAREVLHELPALVSRELAVHIRIRQPADITTVHGGRILSSPRTGVSTPASIGVALDPGTGQRLAQERAAAVQARHHRAERNAEDVGDLPVLQLVHVAEHDDFL